MALVAVLLLAGAVPASCMEMRETVERMVMVRTTGSDLQPAATGFIYKKNSDGPASVIKMGESEIMEQLSKMYKKPESFTAPLPATGPFAKDEDKAASHTEEHVIPVVEKDTDDHEHDKVDGIAEVDYEKMFKEYAADFGDYNNDFADYLHGVGHFDHGIFHGHKGGNDYRGKGFGDHGDEGYKGYASKHNYGKGGAGDYHTEKYERYSISTGKNHNGRYGDDEEHGKHFALEGHDGRDHGHQKAHTEGEEVAGYHRDFDKNEYKKDHDFIGGEKVQAGFGEHPDRHDNHGSDAGEYKAGDARDSGHDEGGFGKGGFHEHKSEFDHGAKHSGDEPDHHEGDFNDASRNYGGKSYAYKIEH